MRWPRPAATLCENYAYSPVDRRRQRPLPRSGPAPAGTPRDDGRGRRLHDPRRASARGGAAAGRHPRRHRAGTRERLRSRAALTEGTEAQRPPVILISAYPEQDLAELIDASPAVGFLAKSGLSGRAIFELVGRT